MIIHHLDEQQVNHPKESFGVHMLALAKSLVSDQETRLQDNITQAMQRVNGIKADARLQARKAQHAGTYRLFSVAENAEPTISALLEDQRIPQTPIHAPIRRRIERFNTPCIADYDQLNSKTVIKSVRGLRTWDLLKVDRRERQTKNRKTVFKAVTKELEKDHKRLLNS